MERITLATPSGLADLVTYSLGFEPTNALAVVFIDNKRVTGMFSIQIADHDDNDREDVHADALTELQRGAAAVERKMLGAAVVLAFTTDYATGSSLGHAAAARLALGGRDVDDVLIVSNGQVHTISDTSRREPLDPDVAAALTASHGAPVASRAAAIEDYRPADADPLTTVDDSAAWHVWAALLDLTGPDLPASPALAAAGALLTDITARDRLIGYLLHRDNLDLTPPPFTAIEREWLTDSTALTTLASRVRAVCRATPAPQAANILAVAALIEGYSGNGARARIAADLAAEHQPGHTFAHLILTALNLGANIRALFEQDH